MTILRLVLLGCSLYTLINHSFLLACVAGDQDSRLIGPGVHVAMAITALACTLFVWSMGWLS